ncbi:MAG: hydantoinase/oxoprolinase family protein [Gammaproteobacteria bacterium]|nr:hydantoinase/oxoprolinase family protein [Gammaproteobacteria bacterium]
MTGESRVGIDVGGTNTDAVVVQDKRVVSSYKTPTTVDVTEGVIKAIKGALEGISVEAENIDSLMIGTTHFTNAVVERKGLFPVGVIRVALPSARALPPLTDWPSDLAPIIGAHCYMVKGGYRYDGEVANNLDERAVVDGLRAMKHDGIRTVAVTGLFSPVHNAMEERVGEIVREEIPDAHVTLSSTIGRIGLLDRENAAILNASLVGLSSQVVASLSKAFDSLGISAPLYVSQNDGTLMSKSFVEKYPVLTFASGPTNSMRGAGYLSGLKDALVVDVGGTTTDIGVLTQGFPRESSTASSLGGIMTNFRMPDILVRALGGGSVVRQPAHQVCIGPDSVGFALDAEALVFGGATLTATDLAVAAGYADIGDASAVRHLPKHLVESGVDRMREILEEGIDRMKTSAEPMPLVLVGGGSVLIQGELDGVSEVVVPEHADVANAVGATIASVSGEIDRIFSYDKLGRETSMKLAKEEALERAVAAGARRETVEIIDVEELPVAYVPGGSVRLRVKAAGEVESLSTKGA